MPKNLLLLDVDNTLVETNNGEIFVYRKAPGDIQEVQLTPSEYALQNHSNMNYFDFRDFQNPEKLKKSIWNGKPIISTLMYVDIFVHDFGYEIGILTSRSMESIIFHTMNEWLKMKLPDGTFVPAPLRRDLVFAINDEKYHDVFPKRMHDAARKAKIVKDLAAIYHSILFLDDDTKNIRSVERMHLENVRAIQVGWTN